MRLIGFEQAISGLRWSLKVETGNNGSGTGDRLGEGGAADDVWHFQPSTFGMR